MSKKLLVLGASGQTGQELLKQALERNHHVTALVSALLMRLGPAALGLAVF